MRISVLTGRISTKLATNYHHVSGGFQGQRSKVKVTASGGKHFEDVAPMLTHFLIHSRSQIYYHWLKIIC